MSAKVIKAIGRVYNSPDFPRQYVDFKELKKAFHKVHKPSLTFEQNMMAAMIAARVPVKVKK